MAARWTPLRTQTLKAAAAGRELELLDRVGGIDIDLLDSRHHSCPKCGGDDRFRLIDEVDGAVYCNNCFHKGNGDFIAAIMHYRGWSFTEACDHIAAYLNYSDGIAPPASLKPLAPVSPHKLKSIPKQIECASPEVRDKAYRQLLGNLPITEAHRKKLHARGFTDEEIAEAQFGSLVECKKTRLAVCINLRQEIGDDYDLIPGLTIDARNPIPLPSGILIPVRNLDGLIVALRVRLDVEIGKTKYVWFSSRRARGPGINAEVDVARGTTPEKEILRITEGEFKARLSALRTGVTTLAIPGVNSWMKAILLVEQLQPGVVRIAMDSDCTTNTAVASAIEGLHHELTEKGATVELELWDLAVAKGFDDLLLKGQQPSIVVGDEAVDNIERIVKSAEEYEAKKKAESDKAPNDGDRTVSVEEVTARAKEKIAAGGEALFTDIQLLKDLACLAQQDPAAFAVIHISLKAAKISSRNFNQAIKQYSPSKAVNSVSPKDQPAEVATNRLPIVYLPGGRFSITQCSIALGDLMASTEQYYSRSGIPVRSITVDGNVQLDVVKPVAACSDFEKVATLFKEKRGKDGPEEVPDTANEADAKQILHCREFYSRLPAITVLSHCPVLLDHEGELLTVAGYHRPSGVWASGEVPPDITLEKAKSLLFELIADFDFATPGDRSRALAAFITPAMVHGGLLAGRPAVDFGEADQSQTGKGFRAKLITTVYRTGSKLVSQRDGGVGSIRELFDTALISGAPFILLDNLRGKIDFPWLESFLTEDDYWARIPYQPAVRIDPSRVVVTMTSNKAEMAGADLPNRLSVVRIKKRPNGYVYRKYPEIGLLNHVKANQPKYLGAVFAIIREWHRRGKPQLEDNQVQHDFKAWAKTLGWIVQHILGEAPLTEGHQTIQQRIASSALNWLRDIALAVRKEEMLDRKLRCNEILKLAIDENILTHGVDLNLDLEDDVEFRKASRAIGRQMAKVVSGEKPTQIDDIEVHHLKDVDDNYREKTFYLFLLKSPQSAPNETPNKTEDSPNPPIHSKTVIGFINNTDTGGTCNYMTHIALLETGRGLGESGAIGGKAEDGGSATDCGHLEHDDPEWWIKIDGKFFCPRCNAERKRPEKNFCSQISDLF